LPEPAFNPPLQERKTMPPFATLHRPAGTLAVLALALALSACGKKDADDTGSTPGSTGSGATPSASSGTEAARTPSAGDSPAGGSSGFKGGVPAADASGAPSSGGTTAPAAGGAAPASSPAAASSAASGTTTNGGLPASQLGSIATPGGSKNSSPNNSTGNAAR
jgi:hypothetical protein